MGKESMGKENVEKENINKNSLILTMKGYTDVSSSLLYKVDASEYNSLEICDNDNAGKVKTITVDSYITRGLKTKKLNKKQYSIQKESCKISFDSFDRLWEELTNPRLNKIVHKELKKMRDKVNEVNKRANNRFLHSKPSMEEKLKRQIKELKDQIEYLISITELDNKLISNPTEEDSTNG